MYDELLLLALILNSVSVAATHCVVGESHLHWSHRRWSYKSNWTLPDGYTVWKTTYLPVWCNWFHVFSLLRWPLLILVVYQLPTYYWIVVPVALQTVWWVTKKAFRKNWKSWKNPL